MIDDQHEALRAENDRLRKALAAWILNEVGGRPDDDRRWAGEILGSDRPPDNLWELTHAAIRPAGGR